MCKSDVMVSMSYVADDSHSESSSCDTFFHELEAKPNVDLSDNSFSTIYESGGSTFV